VGHDRLLLRQFQFITVNSFNIVRATGKQEEEKRDLDENDEDNKEIGPQDGDQWLALATKIMKLRIPQNSDHFWSC
jgi:hypothetical protein